MRQGVWHQVGHNLHLRTLAVVKAGIGEGSILSSGDATYDSHKKTAKLLRSAGSQVLIDTQFHTPSLTNPRIETYPYNKYRLALTGQLRAGQPQLDSLAETLEEVNRELRTVAILAPSLIYEPSRPDIVDLNSELFSTAKLVGDSLGTPTIATVGIDSAVAASSIELDNILGHCTSLGADGFYLCYEFPSKLFRATVSDILTFSKTCLKLAACGVPLIHGYAGPLSLLSVGCGAQSVALSPFLSMWAFTKQRLEPSTGGGDGSQPRRFFSTTLWSRIAIPDDLFFVPQASVSGLLQIHSPFSNVLANSDLSVVKWTKGDSEAHAVWAMGDVLNSLLALKNYRQIARQVIQGLQVAQEWHNHLRELNAHLKAQEETVYHQTWISALTRLLAENSDDFDFLELLAD